MKKENALRLLEGSESSSVCGSARIDDELEMPTASIASRPQTNERPRTPPSDVLRSASASLPEGISTMSEGKSPRGRRKTQKQVGFASSKGSDDGSDSKLSGDLKYANLLSRFDYEDRDAIGRQVEKNSTTTSNAASGRGTQIRSCLEGFYCAKGLCRIRRVNSWSKLINGEESGTEDDSDQSDAEADDYAGISAPLYEVADAIFDFPAQKFFRRQVMK